LMSRRATGCSAEPAPRDALMARQSAAILQ
jgi:hypothetical protein